MKDPLKTAQAGISILTEIMKTAGENPQVREAGVNLGQAALTITKTINNALLPLAAINFAFDKARKYFSEKFKDDLLQKTQPIPLDQIVEPKASVAGPALQGLAFSYEEPNLKEMYLSLLATAMDRRVASSAHPAFVEIIRQLEGQEAGLLRAILCTSFSLPIVQVRLTNTGQPGWRDLGTHLMDMVDESSMEPVEEPNQPAMVDNWIRLGLVEVSYDKHLTDKQVYEWVEKRPEYKKLKVEHASDTTKVTYQRGIIRRSAFGLKFAAAAGLLTDNKSALVPSRPTGS